MYAAEERREVKKKSSGVFLLLFKRILKNPKLLYLYEYVASVGKLLQL